MVVPRMRMDIQDTVLQRCNHRRALLATEKQAMVRTFSRQKTFKKYLRVPYGTLQHTDKSTKYAKNIDYVLQRCKSYREQEAETRFPNLKILYDATFSTRETW